MNAISKVNWPAQKSVRPATDEEVDKLREMIQRGMSVKAVAKALDRSQDFVRRRLDDVVYGAKAEQLDAAIQWKFGWPEIVTCMDIALDGRKFDDVSRAKIEAEWPSVRPPVNGNAIATAVRAQHIPRMTCAELCAREGRGR